MSTTPPRNVIYYNDAANQIPLAGIASLAYTDVILGFLLPDPDGSGNLTGQAYNSDPDSSNSTFDSNGNPNQDDIITLQNAGKNVLISLGGETMSTDDWQQYTGDVSGLVQQVAEYVTSNNLNGVDIDYEDDNGFTGVYDGIQFLTDLTNGLAQKLPPGQNIITHAPAPGYFYSSDIYDNAYTKILAQTGDSISWFNCQFYNNSEYDEPASTKVSSYSTIAETTSASKLLVGAPVGDGAAGSGYLPVNQFIGDVIGPLRQQYPGAFGGVMGWEFSYDQNGTWAADIGLALQQQQQHVFYVGRDGNVHHVYWDPASGINADQWTTDGQAVSNPATLLTGAQQHVFYVGADGNVHHVYWDPASGDQRRAVDQRRPGRHGTGHAADRRPAARVLRGRRRQRAPRLLGSRLGSQRRPVDHRRPGRHGTGHAAGRRPAARVLRGPRRQRAPRLLGSRLGSQRRPVDHRRPGRLEPGHAAGRRPAARVLRGPRRQRAPRLLGSRLGSQRRPVDHRRPGRHGTGHAADRRPAARVLRGPRRQRAPRLLGSRLGRSTPTSGPPTARPSRTWPRC